MAHNNAVMRFSKPRDLEAVETAATLDHWFTQFEVYAKRDPLMTPFLTNTWNPNAVNMGFGDNEDGILQASNCKLFLAHVASFLKIPYYNVAIQTRTTSFASIKEMFRTMHNVEKSADTMIDIGTLVYTKAESYASFYAKVVYFIEMNMAGPGITVDYVNTGADGDKISVTLLDLAAVIWLGKIDPRLYDRVKQDYAVQIKNGTRLSALVPQIAKAIPGILKNLDSLKNEVASLIRSMELDTSQNDDDDISGTTTPILRVSANQRRNNFNRRGQMSRGGRPGNSGAIPRNTPARQNSPICSHCNWLRTFLKISEVDPYHPTSSCSRAIPSQIKNIIDSCP